MTSSILARSRLLTSTSGEKSTSSNAKVFHYRALQRNFNKATKLNNKLFLLPNNIKHDNLFSYYCDLY
ncbi:hypothetical protein HPGCJGGD_2019 [Methylobacterium haplocladii]|nr:hypothetical protein HPGCJGGD_2019 [Methylobacterium haplocladii]